MPTSAMDQIPDVLKAVLAYRPSSVLDVGIGYGKYGFLLREYLAWNDLGPVQGFSPGARRHIIDGVEAFAAYVGEVQRLIYDSIYICDISRECECIGEYDVIMMIDVLEHLSREKGLRTLDCPVQRCRRGLVVSTPVDPEEQGSVFGNEYERHVSVWRRRDFRRWAAQCVRRGTQLIVCISCGGGQNQWAVSMQAAKRILGPLRRAWWKFCKNRAKKRAGKQGY